jgi:DNA integrity scanning protein DisA with diadenylate cyclase activity
MSTIGNFNRRLAERITAVVSSMWGAYIFGAIALISLPAAIESGDSLTIVDWVAQTFLQLVLLSIIMVGQSRSSKELADQIADTHAVVLKELELAKESRAVAEQELREIKQMAAEMHALLREKS